MVVACAVDSKDLRPSLRRLHHLTMTRDLDWEADLRRYPMPNRFGEQQLWAIWIYRFGRRVDRRRPGPVRWILTKVYKVAFKVVQILTGITMPKSATIGPGLLIWHPGSLMIHENSKIGANCTLRHGVSIGVRYDGGPVPVVEDDVELGAYAQILGGVRIGRGAKIGAMAVVLRDVPPGATAVGNPARIIERRPQDEDYRIEVPEEEEPIEPAVLAPDDGSGIIALTRGNARTDHESVRHLVSLGCSSGIAARLRSRGLRGKITGPIIRILFNG
jgi:serine O-acetyltransferase